MSDFENFGTIEDLETIPEQAATSGTGLFTDGETEHEEELPEQSGVLISDTEVIEYGGQFDHLSDFSGDEQTEIILSDDSPADTTAVSPAPVIAGQGDTGNTLLYTLDDSGNLSLIGVMLTDEEKKTFLDSLKDDAEFREKFSEGLETILTNQDSFLEKQDTYIQTQQALLEVNTAVAQNQTELASILKVSNALLFALLFGILSLFGVLLAKGLWDRFH